MCFTYLPLSNYSRSAPLTVDELLEGDLSLVMYIAYLPLVSSSRSAPLAVDELLDGDLSLVLCLEGQPWVMMEGELRWQATEVLGEPGMGVRRVTRCYPHITLVWERDRVTTAPPRSLNCITNLGNDVHASLLCRVAP